MGRWLGVFGSAEFKAFAAVWAVQFITFWFAANSGPNPYVVQLGGAAAGSTPAKPNPSEIPPVGQNSLGGLITIATHPALLHYTLEIFLTNLSVMLLLAIPFFGFAYGEYVAFKLGAVVDYYVNNPAMNGAHLSALVVTGSLLTQPFYYCEMFGFALACSAGLLAGVTLFRPARRRIVWLLSSLAVSALLLFVGAFLEASLILHYA